MARIVMMLNRLVIGGAPLDTVQLAGFLSKHHEVYLIVGEKNQDELDASFLTEPYPNLTVLHLPGMKRSVNIVKDCKVLFAARRLLKKLAPQIVHTHGAKAGIIGRLAAKSTGVKIILHTYHGHVFHSYFNSFVSALIIRVERWLASISTAIVSISEHQKTELANIYKICSEEKLEVVKLGIEAGQFEDINSLKRNNFRKKYLLKEKEVAIGIIGRIVPIKGLHFFAQVAELVLKSTAQPVRFFIIGDGELRDELQQLFAEKNIQYTYFPDEPRVAPITFTSWILDMQAAMAGLDIISLTSLNEGTPLALLEAQAAGKPVVATNVGAVKEIVLHGQSGFVAEYGDVSGFASFLLNLIENTTLREEMGKAGQAFMLKTHTKHQQFEAIIKLYKRLLGV